MWHTVFKNGRKTFLYTRPLRINKAKHQLSDTTDLCQIIDLGSSSLNSERSGSALVSPDGAVQALMGYHKHWNITPKTSAKRKKLAWAVPAHVIQKALAAN